MQNVDILCIYRRGGRDYGLGVTSGREKENTRRLVVQYYAALLQRARRVGASTACWLPSPASACERAQARRHCCFTLDPAAAGSSPAPLPTRAIRVWRRQSGAAGVSSSGRGTVGSYREETPVATTQPLALREASSLRAMTRHHTDGGLLLGEVGAQALRGGSSAPRPPSHCTLVANAGQAFLDADRGVKPSGDRSSHTHATDL